jgi:hypothetical protein
VFKFNCVAIYNEEIENYPSPQSFFNDYKDVKSFYKLKEDIEKDKIFTNNEKQIILKAYDTILTEDEIKIYFDYRRIYDIKINDKGHVLLYYNNPYIEHTYIDLTDLYLKNKNIFNNFEGFLEKKTKLECFFQDEY